LQILDASVECNGRRNEAQMRRGSAKARRYGTQMATKWFGPMSQSTEASRNKE
jgi:hypothetical protein